MSTVTLILKPRSTNPIKGIRTVVLPSTATTAEAQIALKVPFFFLNGFSPSAHELLGELCACFASAGSPSTLVVSF